MNTITEKFRMYNNRSLKTLLKYSMHYKWIMIGVLLMSVCSSVFGAIPAWLSKYFVDDVLVKEDSKMVVYILLAYVITTAVKVVTAYLASIFSSRVTETIIRDIRRDIFCHLQSLPIRFYKKNKMGDLMARLSGDAQTLGHIGFHLFDMLKEFLAVLALTVRLFQVDLALTLISLIIMPVLISVVRNYTKKIRKSGRIRQDTAGSVTAFIQEALSGIYVIKAFHNEERMIKKYKEISQTEFEKAYRSRKIKAKVNPINEVITTLMIGLVAAYGWYLVMNKRITSGDLASFVTALGLMHQPLKRFITKNNDLQEALPSADRIIEIFDEIPEPEVRGEAPEPGKEIRHMEFRHVCFHYDDQESNTLHDINLRVKTGDVVALVGKSGSGKTTLVNLIPRFYDVTEGGIYVNGEDIRRYSLHAYRSLIGVVPQESFLFSGTIADNIAFGKEDADPAEIEQAARLANAWDFIDEFPEKMDTEVGEKGTFLSGGQKQRIAIARALIKDPKILILDEATSSLDTESERLVQDALDKLMKNRTTFVIAHRLSTILKADLILVMEEGRIKETGRHEELLKKGGLYKYYYDIQFNGQELQYYPE
ncbi:MAG: ABC transporter ATP-binding protein/permease [Fusobacteriaceae bacterium]|jgi:ATP-binding cassette subfamily B protein/subfamily B ATP-binding cassette protein MsbA|nr:ABC transporter ATP-binding protein/permease [Fusobacteriaceae bacterium]